MKKRLISILLTVCMMLFLVPNTAFAEGEAEESPVCTCETACTVESMNVACPVCGAEGASYEECRKCTSTEQNSQESDTNSVSDNSTASGMQDNNIDFNPAMEESDKYALESNKYASTPAAHTHCACGKTGATESGHNEVTSWTAISSLGDITQSGNYYLTQNVKVTSTYAWECNNNVQICLNVLVKSLA